MRHSLKAVLLAGIFAVAGCDQNGSFSGGGAGGGSGPGQTRQAQGVSLTFPQDWQVNEGGGAVLVGRAPRDTAQDRFVQSVNVQLLPRGRKESAPGFIERHEAAAAAGLRGYALVEEEDATLDGNPAHRIVFTHQASNGMWIKVLAYTVAAVGRGYAVNCSAEEGKFDLYKDRFEEVCHSLHVDNAQARTIGHAGGGSLIPEGG